MSVFRTKLIAIARSLYGPTYCRHSATVYGNMLHTDTLYTYTLNQHVVANIQRSHSHTIGTVHTPNTTEPNTKPVLIICINRLVIHMRRRSRTCAEYAITATITTTTTTTLVAVHAHLGEGCSLEHVTIAASVNVYSFCNCRIFSAHVSAHKILHTHV